MLAVRTPNLAGSRACRHVVGRHHALPAASGIKSVYLDGFATNLRRRRLAVDSRAVLSSATPATYGDQDPQLAYMQADSIEQPEATGWKAILASVGKAAGALALAVVLIMGTAAPALAARSGGRMGGSSFSSRSFSGPSTGGGYNYRYRSPNPSMRGSGTVMRTTGGVTFLPSFFFPMAPWGMGYGFGGGSTLLNLIFLAIAMWAVVSVARGIFADDGDTYEEEYYEDPKVAVGRVQVGLLGNARQLKRDLERMADGADTSSNTGLHYLLQETVLALQRNPEYCVYGYADGSVTRGLDKAETAFNELAMKERAKFKEETLVNVSGRRSQQEMSRGGGGVSELIVVTLLVAAEQPLRLPKVDSMATLQEALTKLGSVSADNLCALEILWTPQDDDDFYTSQQLMTDYPYLNNL